MTGPHSRSGRPFTFNRNQCSDSIGICTHDLDRQADGTRATEGPQQQLTVVGIDTRQVYAQQGFTGAKEDAEGSVARQVLERLDLDGHCVLADARTQRSTAELILQGGGDYVFVVKGNQPSLLAQLQPTTGSRCRAPRASA